MPHGDLRPRGTLVFLHAFPLNARMWEPQFALAELGWRIVAPQLGAFDGGTSTPQAPASSMDDYAGEVVDLLDALRVPEAVICGLSMGGYVAFALIRRAPRYVRGLVLADTRPQADTAEGVEARKRMLSLVREQGAAGVAAVANEMLPKLLSDATRQQHSDIVDRVRALMLANSADAIAAAITALMTRPDSTPLLPEIHCPTLILVGEHDVVTPPPLSEALHGAIAGSELVTIAGAGHLSSIEQPTSFNAALARFLEHRV
jgi:pimeloyl-ACP methyl ester carboxylesterase